MTLPVLRESVAHVDLDAVAANTEALRRRAGVDLVAVVKADAYGLGAEACAEACLDGGAAMLAVATVEEALCLRAAGQSAPILVLLGVGNATESRAAADTGLEVAAWSEEQFAMLDDAGRSGRRVRVHLKVDTGLTRLGVLGDEAPAAVRAARRRSGIELAGIYTHLASSDEPDLTTTHQQLRRFREVLRAVDDPPASQHALATAGILALDRADMFTAVRPGLGLYGVPPAPHLADVVPLRPALSLTTRLARVREVPAGTGVSYGHAFVAPRAMRVGTIPFGYADGLPRSGTAARMLVRGRLTPVVGRVCMDLCMLDLSEAPGAVDGDEVVILGEQNGARRTADDLAREVGTINYEILTNLHPRVPRLYLKSGRVVGAKTVASGHVRLA